MEYIEIEGGHTIQGELAVQGSKNAALPMMAAALLTSQSVVLERCPQIEDVRVMCKLLQAMGAEVHRQGEQIFICARRIRSTRLPKELASKMRSSIMLMGPLLARTGEAEMCFPGGCVIGARPIDLHVEGLRQLGYTVTVDQDRVSAHASILGKKETDSTVSGYRRIHLQFPSVGATENLLMAAALDQRETIITGAAKEPEVQQLGLMLREMGVEIEGLGSERIWVRGRNKLGGVRCRVMPDRIVAGTYLMAGVVTGGDVLLHYVDPVDQLPVLQVLKEMGCNITYHEQQQWIHLRAPKHLKCISVSTGPHPGFPTDLQAMLMVALCKAKGVSHIEETVFEDRFRHVEALRRMGARISVKGCKATIQGGPRLKAADLWATDLRAGAAMVLAGLSGEGVSRIYNLPHIYRGYESISRDLLALGAHINEDVD
ncbi:MAG: UDP-N-acetylglucosamine 1-carboxyvinyltransferase [Firmicutes bacterium]|nr:UDP-N-acetylglucosamine 1-carboxyvinyltransferase [Bacillota bacterium]